MAQLYPSVPAKTLQVDLASTDTTLVIDDILDWNGTALTTGQFSGDYIPATLINDAKTKVEFILITASTITSAAGGGATIYKRGLALYATGVQATDQTEVTANKLDWTAGETKVLIGTNPPYLYGTLTNRYNDEVIYGAWTLDADNIWSYDAAPTFSTDNQIITKKYADDLAIAGAADANTTTKGIVEEATEAESLAGTDAGSTSARLYVVPSQIAKNAQNAVYSFAADAEASDTYAITLSPAPSGYATGQIFYFSANTANTGAATLNVNSLGAKTIKKNHDQDLEDGDIESGSLVAVQYDGTNFQMLNQQATMPTTALLTEMATFFGSTDLSASEAETLSDGSNADSLHVHDYVDLLGTEDSTTFTDATPTTFWSTTIPANALGTAGAIRGKFRCSAQVATGGGGEYSQIALKYGSTTIGTVRVGNGGATRVSVVEFVITANGASAQNGWIRSTGETTASATTFTAVTETIATGTAAEDSTGALTLALVGNYFQNSTGTTTITGLEVELLQ